MKRLTTEEMKAAMTAEAKVLGAVPYSHRVSRSWRDGLLAAFPALESHERALCYRRLAEYLLFGTFKEEESGRLVVPSQIVAHCADARVGEGGFRALDVLEGFSADVWPLVIHDYVACVSARTVEFEVPDAIIALQDIPCDPDDAVWLVSGLPVSPKSRRKHAERYEERVHLLTDGVPDDHPAAELMRHLNSQPQVALGKYVRSNWHRLEALYQGMPDETAQDHLERLAARHTLDALSDWCRLLYAPSDKTARITAQGVSIHGLPRAMRKAALAGAVEMDIRSSQLAIVGKLWGLPTVEAFLSERRSVWVELSSALGLDLEAAKPALKMGIYAACFGMGRAKLFERLAHGHKKVKGIGEEAARAFLAHPLIREVLRGRSRRMREVIEAGGVEDAFGRWVALSREVPAHAALAIEAQSWELRLMLPLFDVVRDCAGAVILSWLHDGVVVHHREAARVSSLTRRCKEVFDAHAAQLGYVTDLEVEALG